MVVPMLAEIMKADAMTHIQDLFSDSDGSLHIRLPKKKKKVNTKRRRKLAMTESPIGSHTRSVAEVSSLPAEEGEEDNSSGWQTVDTTSHTILSSTKYGALDDRTNKLEILSNYTRSSMTPQKLGELSEQMQTSVGDRSKSNSRKYFTRSIHSSSHAVSPAEVVKTRRQTLGIALRDDIGSRDENMGSPSEEVQQSLHTERPSSFPQVAVQDCQQASNRLSSPVSGFASSRNDSLPRQSPRDGRPVISGHGKVGGYPALNGSNTTKPTVIRPDDKTYVAEHNSMNGIPDADYSSMEDDVEDDVGDHLYISEPVPGGDTESYVAVNNSMDGTDLTLVNSIDNAAAGDGSSMDVDVEDNVDDRLYISEPTPVPSGDTEPSVAVNNSMDGTDLTQGDSMGNAAADDYSSLDDANGHSNRPEQNSTRRNETYIAQNNSIGSTAKTRDNSMDGTTASDDNSVGGTYVVTDSSEVNNLTSNTTNPTTTDDIVQQCSTDDAVSSTASVPSRRSQRTTGTFHGSYTDYDWTKSAREDNSQRRSRTSDVLVKRRSISQRNKKLDAARKPTAKSRYSVYQPELSTINSSPKHYADITQSQKTPKPSRSKYVGLRGEKIYNTPKLIVPQTKEDEDGRRRSQRTRLPRLRNYAGERPIYKFDEETRTYVITDVMTRPPEDDFIIQFTKQQLEQKKGKKRKAKSKVTKAKRRASIDVTLDSDVSFSDCEIPVYSMESEELTSRVVTANGKDVEYFSLDGEVADDKAPVRMCKILETEFIAHGELCLTRLAEKPTALLRGYYLCCKVDCGVVMLTVNEKNKKVMQDGACCVIPDGNSYSLKNLGKTTAKICFTTHKVI